eukprot:366555-Chlamydomonas_euryale.AAC.24
MALLIRCVCTSPDTTVYFAWARAIPNAVAGPQAFKSLSQVRQVAAVVELSALNVCLRGLQCMSMAQRQPGYGQLASSFAWLVGTHLRARLRSSCADCRSAICLRASFSIAVGSATACSPSTRYRLAILILGFGGSSRPCRIRSCFSFSRAARRWVRSFFISCKVDQRSGLHRGGSNREGGIEGDNGELLSACGTCHSSYPCKADQDRAWQRIQKRKRGSGCKARQQLPQLTNLQ